MSEENWKLERDLCRCCLSEGSFKNLAEPCLYEGQEEIYSEMLLEHLSVNLTPVSGPLCTSTYTICEECILRLRDACGFKRQVLLSEKRFRDLYARDVIQMQTSSIGVKKEVPDSDHEANEDDVKVEYRLDDDDDFRLDYDDDDNKSDLELDLQSAKKAKTKKPKAKDKPKPKKRAGRPRKKEAETAAGEAEPPKEKKDGLVSREDLLDYTVVEGGGRRRFGCNKCGAVLSSRDSLRTHIVAGHFRRAPFGCPLCEETFKHKGTRTYHLAKKHGMEERRSAGGAVLQPATRCVCADCHKEFPSRALLARHAPAHRQQRCEDCGVMCGKDEIANHRFEVHGVSMPTCGVCGYRNSKECRVITHQRKVHLKEKNLACPECDARFFDKVQLRKHLVRHNPVRIHSCSFCAKKFPRRSALRAHERIHTGDKRQRCRLCGERFVQKASLNYHLAKRHPEHS